MTGERATVSDRHRELADFLRGRRTRAAPLEGGAFAGKRRRTPGLRREELAQLAGLSVDWYTRLEQGRDVNPSRETLEAIARVLKLDDDERGHLFYLARPDPLGGSARSGAARQEKAEPAMARALEAMRAPAIVFSPRYDVLAWNRAACRLLVDFSLVPSRRRNILWMTFQHAGYRARYAEIGVIEREAVAGFRFSASSYVGDPEFDALIADLLETSETFRMIWARHEVRAKVSGLKAFRVDGRGDGGAEAGPLVLEWHTLASTTASRQQLVYYTARAAGEAEDERRLAELCAGGGE